MSTSECERTYTLARHEGLPVATVEGNVDEAVVLEALEALGEVIAAGEDAIWIVDLAPVDYLSSAGFGRLVALHKQGEAADVEVRFAGIRPEIVEVLDVMRLVEVIQVYPSVDDAAVELTP